MDLNIPKAALATPTPGIHQPAENPTTTRISNLNCDSGRVVQRPPPPPPNALHSEDSNSSSSNMVIDESCNTNHLLPPASQPPAAAAAETDTKPANPIIVEQPQAMNSQLEPDLPPDRPPPEMAEEDSNVKLVPPLRLVVPKFKLRVPKEFQKSVDDALSSSESEEAEDEEECGGEEDFDKSSDNPNDSTATTESNAADANEQQPTAIFNESTPANSQDRDIERNSATESATEAGNSQDDNTYESGRESKTPNRTLSQDDDDSLDEPNSNLVRIMQEIERTKKDIKRTKKTSFRNNNNNNNNNQNKQFAEPRQPTLSQCSIRTADHNWSPTPPASPNSRWFTPRRSTVSQSDDALHQRLARSEESLLLLPTTSQSEAEAEDIPAPVVLSAPTSDLSVSPAKSYVTQERRDTIGSDMMDIDETITAQPTQTIYG